MREFLACKNFNRQPTTMLSHGSYEVTSGWLMDSRTTHHLTNNTENLTYLICYTSEENMAIVNGSSLGISGHVSISVISLSHTASVLHMLSVLHTPTVSLNLISVHNPCFDNNVIVEFHATHSSVKEAQSKKVIIQGTLVDDLYKLEDEVHKHFSYFFASTDNTCNKGTFFVVPKATSSSTFSVFFAIKSHV